MDFSTLNVRTNTITILTASMSAAAKEEKEGGVFNVTCVPSIADQLGVRRDDGDDGPGSGSRAYGKSKKRKRYKGDTAAVESTKPSSVANDDDSVRREKRKPSPKTSCRVSPYSTPKSSTKGSRKGSPRGSGEQKTANSIDNEVPASDEHDQLEPPTIVSPIRTTTADRRLRRAERARKSPKGKTGRTASSLGTISSRKRARSATETEIAGDDDCIDTIARGLIRGDSVQDVEPGFVPDVIARLHELHDIRQQQHKLVIAGRIELIIDELKLYLDDAMKRQAQQDLTETVNDQLLEAQDRVSRLQSSTNRTSEKIRSKYDDVVAQTKARHKEEEEQLLAKWQSPTTVRYYNRASVALQELRHQSALLLASRRYGELRIHEQRVKELADDERNEQYRQMRIEYEQQLTGLQARHQIELKTIHGTYDDRSKTFMAAADIELGHARRRVQAVESKYDSVSDPDRVWNLHHRHERQPTSRSSAHVRPQYARPAAHEVIDLQLPPLSDPRRSPDGSKTRAHVPVQLKT